MSSGRFGEVATYLAGRRVPGVRFQAEVVEIHVVAGWGIPVQLVAEQIRAVSESLAEGRRVDVYIDDLAPIPGAPELPAPAA